MNYYQLAENQQQYDEKVLHMSEKERRLFLEREASFLLGESPLHPKQLSLESLSETYITKHAINRL